MYSYTCLIMWHSKVKYGHIRQVVNTGLIDINTSYWSLKQVSDWHHNTDIKCTKDKGVNFCYIFKEGNNPVQTGSINLQKQYVILHIIISKNAQLWTPTDKVKVGGIANLQLQFFFFNSHWQSESRRNCNYNFLFMSFSNQKGKYLKIWCDQIKLPKR
jgi:hypothetical protein